jgi:hypothetical protein
MIVRPPQLRAIPSFLVPISKSTQSTVQLRCLHQRITASRIPVPTPFVPDPSTFLTLIGRNLSQHASKIPSWEALFSLTSTQLKELGVEPPRSRRYLLRWREKFRNGEFGVGGEAKSVVDGVAEVRVVEIPTTKHSIASTLKGNATATMTAGTRKIIINTLPGTVPSNAPTEQLSPIKGLKIRGSHTITGPHVLPAAGGCGKVSKIVVKEGLWEDRRGHKIDGGERRQAEVRAKRRSEERKTTR